MDARRFPDADSLLAHLRQEDAPGMFLYRGQTKRYAPHAFRAEDGSLVAIESLYPNDFRFARTYDAWTPDLPARITAARDAGRDRRDRFQQFLAHKTSEGSAALRWFKDILDRDIAAQQELYDWFLTRPEFRALFGPGGYAAAPIAVRIAANDEMRRRGIGISSKCHTVTWSLAQHYELATALVDLTDDCRVALWFATNEWEPARPPPASDSEGVVYRFDRQQLEHALDAYFMSSRLEAIEQGLVPPPPFFVQPIADIPPDCALRPSRQRGYSVYGLDQMRLIQFILEREICAVFTFAHGRAPALGPIDRDYLVPQDDPFDAILAAWRTLA